MKNKILLFLLVAGLLAGCGAGGQEKVYRNRDFGYSITYPSGYQAKEIKWVKESTGVTLQGEKGAITVQAMAAGTDYENLPFDRYVRIAAASEIQNYEKLVSIESFTSEYGIKGYRTYWQVIEHEDTDTGEINATTTAGPIYYFPLQKKQKLGQQPVKTIMISGDGAMQPELEQVAGSLRYLNSFMKFFHEKQRGKLFFVEKGKPFRIELDSNPTTGYNWYITEMDEGFFQVRSSGYQAQATGRVGSGGKSYWNIIPLKEGISTIRLLYYRVWEGKDKAVDKYEIRVLSR